MTAVAETHFDPSAHGPLLRLNWKICKTQHFKLFRKVFTSIIVKTGETFPGCVELMAYRLTPTWDFLFGIELRSDCTVMGPKIKPTSCLMHKLSVLLSHILYTSDGRN